MKNVNWLALLSIALTTGCAAMMTKSVYHYDIDAGSNASDDSGALTVIDLHQRDLPISYQNKSKETQRIIWDEVSIVGVDGQLHKVIHNGVKFSKAGEPMAPTAVPAGVTLSDSLVYADGLQPTFGPGGSWVSSEIIYCSAASAICDHDAALGKELTVLLPIEQSGKRHDYTVKLRIKKAL